LRTGLQELLGNRQIRVVEVAQVDADAYLIAEYIAQQRRVSFRRVVRQRFSAPSALVSASGEWSAQQTARTE